VDIHPDRRDAFLGFMREAVTDIIEEPDGPQPAPERERAGHS
jgi:hypothetical protein